MTARRASAVVLLALAGAAARAGGMTRPAPLERPNVPDVSPLNMRLTIRVADAPLGRVLETITAQTKANFLLAEESETERVTIDAKDKRTGEILAEALRAKGLAFRRVGRTNSFVVASRARDAAARAQEEMMREHGALNAPVSVSVADAPLKEFLDSIAAQARVGFTLDGDMGRTRVTANLKDLTAREALELVLEVKGLDIAYSGKNVFRIRRGAKRAGP